LKTLATLAAFSAISVLPLAAAPVPGCAYDSMLFGDGTSVHVTVSPKEACSIGTYTVTIAAKGVPAQTIRLKRDGTLMNVYFEDVTGDGKRDLVVVTQAAGSGAYGHVDIWEWKHGRYSAGIVAELTEEQRAGHQGHDTFTAAAGVLRRRFPVYAASDANCCPSGGTAALRWDAKKNGWIRE
jgi:Periplasmic lysozyme inhibitor of I-type lysozyme